MDITHLSHGHLLSDEEETVIPEDDEVVTEIDDGEKNTENYSYVETAPSCIIKEFNQLTLSDTEPRVNNKSIDFTDDLTDLPLIPNVLFDTNNDHTLTSDTSKMFQSMGSGTTPKKMAWINKIFFLMNENKSLKSQLESHKIKQDQMKTKQEELNRN
eukprot:UN24677